MSKVQNKIHADIKEMSFERALKELESIVSRLERGDVELEVRARETVGQILHGQRRTRETTRRHVESHASPRAAPATTSVT